MEWVICACFKFPTWLFWRATWKCYICLSFWLPFCVHVLVEENPQKGMWYVYVEFDWRDLHNIAWCQQMSKWCCEKATWLPSRCTNFLLQWVCATDMQKFHTRNWSQDGKSCVNYAEGIQKEHRSIPNRKWSGTKPSITLSDETSLTSLTSQTHAVSLLVLCLDPTQLTREEGVWCHKSKSLG